MKHLLISLALISGPAVAYDALVWGGPGACVDGCVEAAVHVTKLAGFDPMIVTPTNFDPSLLESAKIWVQPGGKSVGASTAMGPATREAIKKFVAEGGGYVGFCAGGFLTTPKVGSTTNPGLGIVDGYSTPYKGSRRSVSLQRLITPQGTKYHYWEGGPYFAFTETQAKKVDVTSRYYRTNQINGFKTVFGTGKIAVTGTHPEAPLWWYEDGNIRDRDGLDNEEAASMIKWAAKK